MSPQREAAGKHIPTHAAVSRAEFTCGRSLDRLSRTVSGGTLSSAGLWVLPPAVDVAALRGSFFLTFPLKKRHDGFHSPDDPSSSLTPSRAFAAPVIQTHLFLLAPEVQTGRYRSPGERCQIAIFPKSEPSSTAILSINARLPGWCGSSIVGNAGLPAPVGGGRCFTAHDK